jgi:hypothetical protein
MTIPNGTGGALASLFATSTLAGISTSPRLLCRRADVQRLLPWPGQAPAAGPCQLPGALRQVHRAGAFTRWFQTSKLYIHVCV